MFFVEVKGILSSGNGMNIYRGCTHGCIYCDSRSLCYQINHSFTDIEVKKNAPELLKQALMKKRKKCVIGTGSMCDPYMPIEKELKLTRQTLQIIYDLGFGAAPLTKSDLILRDLDLLQAINERAKTVVQITLTTYDEKLCRVLEPNVCTTKRRYEVLKTLQKANIPTVVWLCPILPFINDTEENLTGILNYCIDAGVAGIINFGMGTTMRDGSREYFYSQLDKSFPGLKQKYIDTFGNSYECASPYDKKLSSIFHSVCERNGIMHDNNEIFRFMSDFPDKSPKQITFFD